MLDLLLDVGGYALDQLALPIGVAVVTSVATATAMRWREAAGVMADHDRRGAEIAEDLSRWMRDRDHGAGVRMGEIRQDAAQKNVVSAGILAASAGKVYRHVLHEYRDRASIAQRELDALVAAESGAVSRRRRRASRVPPTLMLPDDCRVLLSRWRERAEDDPTRPELQPRLAELEPPLLAA